MKLEGVEEQEQRELDRKDHFKYSKKYVHPCLPGKIWPVGIRVNNKRVGSDTHRHSKRRIPIAGEFRMAMPSSRDSEARGRRRGTGDEHEYDDNIWGVETQKERFTRPFSLAPDQEVFQARKKAQPKTAEFCATAEKYHT